MLRRLFPRVRSIDPGQFTPWPVDAVLVGGAVRDALLGRPPRDLDWLVPDPRAAAEADAGASGGAAFPLDEVRGHWRVVGRRRVAVAGATSGGAPPATAEVRDYVRPMGTVEEDLARRDFTVNAIALTREGDLIDPHRGRHDLVRRRLRMVSRANLEDDPLRLLRAARLAPTLGMAIEPGTNAAIRGLAAAQASGSIRAPAAERVRDELDNMIGDPAAARALLLLDRLGLMDLYLPELARARGVDQKGFHHLPVMRHMIEALHQLLQGFPEADLALRWATLLHDVGKPGTREVDETGRVRFYGHDKLGAELAVSLLRRLRHPETRVKRVAKLIRWHMLPLPKNGREARRFVYRRREVLPDLLKLMIADREAARGPLASEANRRAYRIALARVVELLERQPPRPPPLDGREIMNLLGIAEGPRVGEAMRFLAEAEAVGDVTTRDEAVAALERYAEAQGWGGS